jgi:LemA protein
MKKIYIVLAILIIGAFSVVGWFVGTNNRFVEMKGNATKQWANVESSYQRRSDLIGNLVNTVKGAADFERNTLTAVVEARAKATSTTIDANNLDPAQLQAFQAAQGQLSSALSRLLKANQNFLELQSQLEGTENRINVERNRYNNIAGDYNIAIKKIPASIVANFGNFTEVALFQAESGAETAPEVNFNF